MDAVTPAAMPTKPTSVQISLRAIDRAIEDHSTKRVQELDRCFVLDEENASVIVGRSSRTESKGYVAAKDNAWYDSAVMSRRHAEIMADIENKRVEIKDLNSLHGTFFIKSHLNNEHPELKLQAGQPYHVIDGDKIQFGVSVYRSDDCFEPNLLKVGIKWSEEFPTRFQVPDGSDDGSSDIDENVIDLTQPEKNAPDTIIPGANPRCVIDLSSSPPPSGRPDEEECEIGQDYLKTLLDPLPLPCVSTFRETSSLGPVHTPDTCDIPSSEEVDYEDDAESTDLDASSDVSEEVYDRSQEEDDAELEETSDLELDEDIDLDADAYEDGEVNEDGESSMNESEQDDESDCDFWRHRPEDCLSMTRILNDEMEADMPAPSSVKSRMSVILPELSESVTQVNPETHPLDGSAGMYKRASSVHELCSPHNYPVVKEHTVHSAIDSSNVNPTAHHPAPPATNDGHASISWGLPVSLPTPPTGDMMTARVHPYQPWTPWEGEEVASSPPSKRTHVGISDIVEHVEMAAEKVPRKRNADDISTLNDEEVCWVAGLAKDEKAVAPTLPAPSDPPATKESEDTVVNSACGTETKMVENDQDAVQPLPLKPEENPLVSAVVETVASTERPAKRQRIRDIAERVGYAALGGVTAGAMIVGTLIYTAPTFA